MGEESLKNGGSAAPPTGVSVVRMDEQRRIKIDRFLVASVLGLNLAGNQTARLWALVGSKRQLQVLGPDTELAKARDHCDERLLQEPLNWDSGADEQANLIRKLASFLRLSCHSERKRPALRLTLPADAVALGLVKPGSDLVVFASGHLLELWRPEAWVETCAVADVRELRTRVQEAFGNDP